MAVRRCKNQDWRNGSQWADRGCAPRPISPTPSRPPTFPISSPLSPSGPDGVFTNRWAPDAGRHIGAALRQTDRYHVVNITSTVMPGSTGGEIRVALEQASGRRVGETVGLTYNPEFIALGSVVRDLLHLDVVLIGESDRRAGDLLETAYRITVGPDVPVQRMNWVNAELTKESRVNTFVTTKISYANMLAELCEKLPGADVDVVTAALGQDSRIVGKYLKGGRSATAVRAFRATTLPGRRSPVRSASAPKLPKRRIP